jgi:hypothetical protein
LEEFAARLKIFWRPLAQSHTTPGEINSVFLGHQYDLPV